MRGIVIGLVLLTGCASFNVNAFGVPIDGRNVHAQSSNPADEPGDRASRDLDGSGYEMVVIWVIVAVAAGFGLYSGTSN